MQDMLHMLVDELLLVAQCRDRDVARPRARLKVPISNRTWSCAARNCLPSISHLLDGMALALTD